MLDQNLSIIRIVYKNTWEITLKLYICEISFFDS